MGVCILGLDVGGANIKYAVLRLGEKKNRVEAGSVYFPIWILGKEALRERLSMIVDKVLRGRCPEYVALTMTAELSDVFYTKREGVSHILDSVIGVFKDSEIYVMSVNATFVRPEDGYRDPLLVAAANWPATARLIGKRYPLSLMIDVGSTTTDIIPIRDGMPCTKGKTDLERLMYGELVYTGVLRTPITAITHYVPIRGRMCRISAEKFALSADVHLVLNNITEDEYSCETADGRGKSRRESLARLARVVCADVDMLSEKEILILAEYIYHKQIEQVKDAILQVLSVHGFLDVKRDPVIVLGAGKKILAEPAARAVGFEKIIDFSEVWNCNVAETAYALVLLLAEDLNLGAPS